MSNGVMSPVATRVAALLEAVVMAGGSPFSPSADARVRLGYAERRACLAALSEVRMRLGAASAEQELADEVALFALKLSHRGAKGAGCA